MQRYERKRLLNIGKIQTFSTCFYRTRQSPFHLYKYKWDDDQIFSIFMFTQNCLISTAQRIEILFFGATWINLILLWLKPLQFIIVSRYTCMPSLDKHVEQIYPYTFSFTYCFIANSCFLFEFLLLTTCTYIYENDILNNFLWKGGLFPLMRQLIRNPCSQKYFKILTWTSDSKNVDEINNTGKTLQWQMFKKKTLFLIYFTLQL